MPTRSQEEFRENLRKNIMKDLFTDSRLMNTSTLLHVVDEEPLEKCLLSTYGQMKSLTDRYIQHSEDYTDMEKARDARVDAAKAAKVLDPREIGLEQNLEEVYFNYYGHGAHDSPVPDRPGASYACDCGLKMMMGWKRLPLQCPKCRRITPTGELKRDGVLKR